MLKSRSRQSQQLGMTLIELLLVLVILVVLGSMAVQFFGGTRDKALKDAARIQVSEYVSAIRRYEMDMRRYPTKLEDLITKPSNDAGADRWAGKYMEIQSLPTDPWDKPYKFAAPGKKNSDTFDVWSAGPDGQDGTDDDIGNWTT
jgi:general secretion pathway protein G